MCNTAEIRAVPHSGVCNTWQVALIVPAWLLGYKMKLWLSDACGKAVTASYKGEILCLPKGCTGIIPMPR